MDLPWAMAAWVLLALLLGLPTAWVFGKYLLAVEKRQPVRAAFMDLLILLLSSVGELSLWQLTGNSLLVLIGFAIGNAIGTYLVVKKERKKEKKSEPTS